MKLPDFEGWAIFAQVVESRSFSGAAATLGISKATVSKAIARLEQRLGTALFHRTSRKLTLTASGHALTERAQRILAEAVAAEEVARESAGMPMGLVRVTAPLTLGIKYVAPLVAEFLALHPGVEVDLRLSDAKADIVAEGIDIAIRIAALPDSSLRARRLSAIATHIVASPDYFARMGRPTHPNDLARHACILYTHATNPELVHFNHKDGIEATVRVRGPLRVDNGEAMLPALRAGLGIAFLPDFIIGEELVAGRLEAVLVDWTTPTASLHIVTPPGVLRPARVEALIDFFARRLQSACRDRNISC